MVRDETSHTRVEADGTIVLRRRKRRHRSSGVLAPIAEPRVRMYVVAAVAVVALSLLFGFWIAVSSQSSLVR